LNLSKINKIKAMVNGRILAELVNGEKMIISRLYASNFKNKLKGGNK
jgi:DNA-binding LytR/AlgR family response regulator